MQKVVGSSPISRFRETRATTGLLAFRAELRQVTVDMDHNYVLNEAELEAG
jgi:hypothetical protein